MGDFQDVLHAARGGDDRALGELYRGIYPRFLRYARAFAPGSAEDIASDAWLDVARGLHRFRGDESAFRSWAFTIARRRALDLQRSNARRRTHPADPHGLADASGGNVEEEALASLGASWAIGLIVEALSAEQAEVVLLRVIGDLDVGQVAAIMGKRPGTIRVLQHRGLRRLAETLRREGVTR
ncbi:MAG TPA: sigma-70 family RNA polymerase sigma factor [Actinomycetota bacterium]|jgi:RNA polymerase sigma-70 factor (ECF subfamily)|nr:sigma-70 family RNA polymerase sigma factor [Actinomycetota bacterium]